MNIAENRSTIQTLIRHIGRLIVETFPKLSLYAHLSLYSIAFGSKYSSPWPIIEGQQFKIKLKKNNWNVVQVHRTTYIIS